jgi:hypothetical protein
MAVLRITGLVFSALPQSFPATPPSPAPPGGTPANEGATPGTGFATRDSPSRTRAATWHGDSNGRRQCALVMSPSIAATRAQRNVRSGHIWQVVPGPPGRSPGQVPRGGSPGGPVPRPAEPPPGAPPRRASGFLACSGRGPALARSAVSMSRPSTAEAARDRANRTAARSQEMDRLLRDTFGHADFRPGQRAVTEALLDGRDAIAVMPTVRASRSYSSSPRC